MKNNSVLVMKFHGLQAVGTDVGYQPITRKRAGLEVGKIRRALGWKPQVSMMPGSLDQHRSPDVG